MAQQKIHTRGLTSFFTLFGFGIMSVTGLVLYIVPAGRVAYWVNWELLGMTKTEWGNIHILSSLLFIAAGAFHTYFNWKPLMNYFKNRITSGIRLRKELLIASAVSILVIISSLYPVPPLNYLLDLNIFIKDTWVTQDAYEPPFGHAEMLSLKVFTKKMEIDLGLAEAELKAQGVQFDSAQETLEDISERNDISPMDLYLIIKKFEPSVDPEQLKTYTPEGVELEFSGTGIGNQSLQSMCEKTGIDLSVAIERLKRNGIGADADETIKKMAEERELNSLDILKVILVDNYSL